jgi:hypothetical protein
VSITWQNVTAIGIVLLAAGYVARHAVRLARRKGLPGCGCSRKCLAKPPEKPLVSLDERQEL